MSDSTEGSTSHTSQAQSTKSTASESSDDSLIFLSPSGDLKVHVKAEEKAKTFVVSSYAMCLASPVWRAMLDPSSHFMEASKLDVKFPEDDAASLLLVLHIVHFHFPQVPQVISFEQLGNLATICDKYDTVTLIRPWSQEWITSAQKGADEENHVGQWLFIAWVFGKHEIFQRVIQRLALKCTMPNGPDKPLYSHEFTVPNDCIPGLNGKHQSISNVSGLTTVTEETVVQNRANALLALAAKCRDIIHQFATSKEFICSNTDANEIDRRSCDAQGVGYLIRGLGQHGMWPLSNEAFTTDLSVIGFRNELLAIPFEEYFHKYERRKGGTHCKKFATTIKDMLGQINFNCPGVLTETHQRHLDEQSKK